MYANVVLGIPHVNFEKKIANFKMRREIKDDTQFTAKDLEEMIKEFKDTIKNRDKEFPQDVNEQLNGAIEAVFSSWMNERAITYRDLNNIPGNY
jgi:pyruvate,orthophosphate dikinase